MEGKEVSWLDIKAAGTPVLASGTPRLGTTSDCHQGRWPLSPRLMTQPRKCRDGFPDQDTHQGPWCPLTSTLVCCLLTHVTVQALLPHCQPVCVSRLLAELCSSALWALTVCVVCMQLGRPADATWARQPPAQLHEPQPLERLPRGF